MSTAPFSLACAEEGAQPATTAGAGLTPAQWAALKQSEHDPALRWVLPVGVALGLLLSLAGRMGWLAWLPW